MDLDSLDVRLMQEPPLAWPAPAPVWPWGVAGAILLAALVWAVDRFLRRRTRRPAERPARRAPEQAARAALDRLRREGLVARGSAELLYRALSSIVRSYLADRFGLNAPRLTTEEFLSAAQAILPPGLRERTGAFLERCDLVKFARGSPGVEAREEAWRTAGTIVEEGRAVQDERRAP